MPKFEFAGSSIKNDEDFVAAGGGEKKPRFLNPGRYDVKVAAMEYTGLARDPNWGSMMAVYETADGRTIRDYFMIPFTDHLYGEKRTAFPFKRLQTIATAFGHTLTVANTADVMKTLFGKPEKLVGTPVVIDVGYEGGFIHYAGKNKDGGKKYQIYTPDHNPVRDAATMTPVEFPDVGAAEAYAAANNLPVEKFPRILSISKSASLKAGATTKPW
jgi:hypothetical protein